MKNRVFVLLAVALLLLIGCASADQRMDDRISGESSSSTAENTGEPTTVLIFGASNTFGYMPVAFETHGYRYPYKMRWTTMVAESLGSNYHIVVDGLMGRTINKEHAFYGDYERGTYALPSVFIGN